MTDTDGETIETTEEGSGEESAVIQGFRERERDLKKRLKDAESSLETVVDETKAQVARDLETQRLVIEAGYPKLAEIVSEIFRRAG